MKRSEYIRRAEEARIFSIANRWPRLTGWEITELGPSPFCSLEADLRRELHQKGIATEACWDLCPFKSCSSQYPESLYGKYCSTEINSDEERAAALAIVEFLENLNIHAWANDLLDRGYLEVGDHVSIPGQTGAAPQKAAPRCGPCRRESLLMELQVHLIVEVETSYKDLASSLLQVATNVGRGVDSGTVIAPDGSEVGSWSMELGEQR